MEVTIIKIGNSKGLRLSKTILEKYNIQNKVELILEDDQIILKPIDEPRKGWDKAFEKMHQEGDGKPLMDSVFEDETFEEWN
ncbi:antitoxin MazE [Gelidibacter algens]|uniref:Antitoxin MazE n=1 Tax=Gelidibacter algens TaxID=49280 RepID=A0A1A7R3H2_9FLAO|nr:AbrB/MazE/SpoVT family DNA-binding domain-containing protein [Gelidibacter algens]OBX26810.1 MazF family transcriptional regulator [Gelidibacter algens]RAJ22740.1 antitoxin MazE [Gelidibacter algens]